MADLSVLVALRMTPELAALLDAAATRQETRRSVWMREALARSAINPKDGELHELARALRHHNAHLLGIGRNLNQLARAANSGRAVRVPEYTLRLAIDEISAAREKTGTLLDSLERLFV